MTVPFQNTALSIDAVGKRRLLNAIPSKGLAIFINHTSLQSRRKHSTSAKDIASQLSYNEQDRKREVSPQEIFRIEQNGLRGNVDLIPNLQTTKISLLHFTSTRAVFSSIAAKENMLEDQVIMVRASRLSGLFLERHDVTVLQASLGKDQA